MHALTEETTNKRNQIAYYIMILGLFMAILDIQIVASSLAEIQAAISASMDEISWVQTSYLIAEVIMIPICGWLSDVLSTRILFALSSALFTLSSAACAFAGSLETMIVFRVIQGFFAGAMIPTVFSAVYLIFPQEKQNKATIFAGLIATIAPTLGPTLGGWITLNFSWNWLFLINIVPGIIVTYGVYKLLNIDQPQLNLLKKFDGYGLLYLAVFLGGLEIFLKQGHKNDWFDCFYITLLFYVLIISFVLLITRELHLKYPIVNLKAFKDVNFSIGCMLSFAIGVGLFGSVYLLPMLLATVKHYNSLQIGSVMFVAGAFQFASGPITGMAARKMEPRIMLFFGLFFMGLGTFVNGFMTTDIGYNDLILPQAIRGVSIMMCFVPMTTITLGRLPKKEVKNASGLYNLMRNLGGAIGIAVIDTVLTNRIKFHSAFLSEFINAQKLNQLLGSGKMFSEDLASGVFQMQSMVMKTTQLRITQQALVLGFNDLFCYVGIYLMMCCILVFLIKPVPLSSSVPSH